MTHLLSLPADVLRVVLGFLSCRRLLVASASCKALRDVAATMPLHPVLTSRTTWTILDWITERRVEPRVQTLTASMMSAPDSFPFCFHLHRLPNLSSLSLRFSSFIQHDLPASLQRLELHRVLLRKSFDFPSRLKQLTDLRVLKLTFQDLGDGGIVTITDAPPRLQHLSIRQAPRILVSCPLRLHALQLQAATSLLCLHPVHAEHVKLECLLGPLLYDMCLTPESCAGLRSLDIRCTLRNHPPCLQGMSALERLHVSLDFPVMPLAELAALPSLRCVSVDARYGVEALRVFAARLPPHVAAAITVSGVPMPQPAVDAFFNVERV